MTSSTGKQIIAMQTLPNTSKSKDNQTISFSQLIEYNMKNIFLQKSHTNIVEELVQVPFLKN